MAYATVKGQRHHVRVTQDLTDNFSVEVYPAPKPGAIKRSEPFKTWPVPLCLKVRADSKAHALVGGLEHLKALGQIEDFHIDDNERPPADAPERPAAASGEE